MGYPALRRKAASFVYPILAPRADARFGKPLRGFDLVSFSDAILAPRTYGRFGTPRRGFARSAVSYASFVLPALRVMQLAESSQLNAGS